MKTSDPGIFNRVQQEVKLETPYCHCLNERVLMFLHVLACSGWHFISGVSHADIKKTGTPGSILVSGCGKWETRREIPGSFPHFLEAHWHLPAARRVWFTRKVGSDGWNKAGFIINAWGRETHFIAFTQDVARLLWIISPYFNVLNVFIYLFEIGTKSAGDSGGTTGQNRLCSVFSAESTPE